MTSQSLTNLPIQRHQISLPYANLFDLLIEHIPAAIALLDSQMRYIKVSRRWLSDYGLSDQDIIGKSHCEVCGGLPERWQEIYRRCKTGAVERWEEELPQQESGTTHWIKWEARPWYNSKGEIAGLYLFTEKVAASCSLQDIVSRWQIGQEHLVRSIAARIHQSLNLDEILQTTVDEVRQFLETDRVVIYRFNADWSGVIAVESVAPPWKTVLGTTPQDPCFRENYVQPYQQGRIQVVADIETAGLKQCHIDFLKQFQVKANLVVPIIQEEKLWGLLCAHQCKSPRLWQQIEVNLLQQLATHVAIAIQQCSLRENLQRELAEREATEAALKQSEAKYQKLAANMPGMIYQFLLRTDGSVSFPFVSPGCYSLFGLKSKEIEANPDLFISMTHPDDREQWENSVAVSAQTLQPWKWEGRIILPSGEVRWIQAASQPERCENGDILWDGLLMDVTARKLAEAELQKAKAELEIRVQQRTAQLSHAIKQLESEIVERRKAEAELRESQQRLSLFFQQTQLAVIERNADLEVTAWNPAAEAIFGYSQQEAIGHNTFELIVPESSAQQVKQVMNDLLAQTGGTRSIHENLTKDGRIIICDWYNTPLIDNNGVLVGVASLALDITDRKRAEEEKQKFIALIESSSDFIGIATLTGEAIYVNEAGQNLVGLSGMDAVKQTSVSEYFTPEDLEYFQQHILPVVLEEGRWEGEFRFRHFKTGAAIPVYYNFFTVKDQQTGQPIAVATVTRDITEQKRSQEALLQKAQELEQSLHKLKTTQAQLIQTEKISSLGQMVAGVAHEVNNPVSFIAGNLHHATQYACDLLNHLQLYQQHFPHPPAEIQDDAENIDLEFLAEDLPKMLSSMLLGTNRIKDIMQSLRSFSRVDGVHAKPVNIHDGLDSTLMILQHRLKKQSQRPAIQVVKEYGNLPPVECYSGQLNQVFMNILANGIDAFDEYNQGRTYNEIELHPNVIRIRTEVIDGDLVAIRIQDNGPGMTESVQQKLFQPFFTTKPVGIGTGLGLSISYQIVSEIHKGQLKCISAPGKGTEFVIEIPIRLKVTG